MVAACEGAIAAGASEILIKDAHGSGRNIIAARLPDCARLIRGWSGHPLCMVQELDESFDALMFAGLPLQGRERRQSPRPYPLPQDQPARDQRRDRLGAFHA